MLNDAAIGMAILDDLPGRGFVQGKTGSFCLDDQPMMIAEIENQHEKTIATRSKKGDWVQGAGNNDE
jgi:hypothetical protein